MSWRVALLALALGAAALAAAPPRPAPAPAADLLSDRLWDDGKAEYSIYRGTTPRYGEGRPTELRMVVVKEDLFRDALVKSERGPLPGRTVEAIKLNLSAEFRTGTYDYRQTASVFFERRTMKVLKEVMTHHELCGITFVRVGPSRGRWTHQAHSYWEGEGDREVPLAWPGDGRERLFADGLPVSLRRWVAARAPRASDVWLLPSQISGHAPIENTRPVAAKIRVGDASPIQVPAGRFIARKVEVATAAGADAFWFDRAAPHVLLRWETRSGRKLALERTLRLDYWKHHANGDERLLGR